MYKILILGFCLFVLSTIYAENPKVLNLDKNGKIIIEAENFSLNECQVIKDAKASDGKSVKLLNRSSSGKITVKIQKGEYSLMAIIYTANEDHDAFLMKANGRELRTYPANSYGKYAPCVKMIVFTVDNNGIAEISFRVAEFDMLIDRFEITKVKT